MSHIYDAAVSRHYAAYRPPLHAIILEKLLEQGRYGLGVDVGCGTGQSSVPLSKYCETVMAIDPSPEMLEQAAPHPQIQYMVGRADGLPLPNDSADLIAFAGSLFYTKTEATLQELRRVSKKSSIVLVYDFELLIYDHLSEIGFDLAKDSASYDHSVSFSEVETSDEIMKKEETVVLAMNTEELAHVILSTHDRYLAISNQLKTQEPFVPLTTLLAKEGTAQQIRADLYYSSYRI